MPRKRGNGEGGLWYDQGKKLWRGAFAGRDVYGKSKSEAGTKLDELKRQVTAGQRLSGSGLRTGQYIEGWLVTVMEPQLAERGYEEYAYRCARVVKHLGTIPLRKLRPQDIRGMYAALDAEGLSASTIRGTHRTLKQALKQAVLDRDLLYNPCDAVKPPRDKPTRSMTILTEPQLNHLLESSSKTRWYPLWMVLASTGLRIGEALGLTWGDIDTEKGVLHVERGLKQLRGGRKETGSTKSRSSRRTVHLTDRALQALREAPHSSVIVFPDTSGGHMWQSAAARALHTACERAGVPRITPHDFRHTCATLLLERGVNVKFVSEMLGHSSPAITLQLYAHVTERMHQDAVGVMEEILSG